MSKYDALGNFLRQQGRDRIPMTFAEIEKVIGGPLPRSQRYPAWWSNNPSNNVMTPVWLGAGYRTEQVDVVNKRVVFCRDRSAPPNVGTPHGQTPPRDNQAGHAQPSGMSDAALSFEGKDDMTTDCIHPAYGWMKGMFTITPGTDLTAPVYTDEEWAEIEKEMEEDWDEIERGMGGKK